DPLSRGRLCSLFTNRVSRTNRHFRTHGARRRNQATHREQSGLDAIKQAALANGMVTLKQEGADRVIQGHTTLAEVMRITQQEIDVD
ncbi:MAG: hypothetical protein HC801_10430, partial [Nitrospira sp.]|nr:hypothetical protein [Nitrospira sp.]